jgi:uncharacterized protein YndB with AHSA1/START domain
LVTNRHQPDEETKMSDILLQLTIATASDKVFKALTEQHGLEAWWTTHMVAKPKVGSPVEAYLRGGQQVIKMEMRTLEPGRKVVWGILERVAGWGGSQFTWDLSPVENGTKVLFGFVTFPPQQMATCQVSPMPGPLISPV